MDQNIILVNDEKFKSIFISVNFMRSLNKEETGKNALVASVLKKGTEKLKSEKEIDLHLAKLYSSNIDINVEKVGGIYNVEFGAEFINKKYIDEDVSDKVIDLLYDIIYNPYLENGAFSKDVFNREKDALIEKINQEKNDKRRWALRRLEEEMYSHNDYSVATLGTINEISKQTEKTVYEYYRDFLNTSEVRIVVVGNLDGYDNIANVLKDRFIKNTEKVVATNIDNRQTFKSIAEFEPLNQSVLCLGLNVKETEKEKTHVVAVYSSILGGTPASKLFQNVREKESLAYFAKSQYNKYINGIYIYSGINLSNVDKATEVIKKQIKDIKDGVISDEEIETAKKNIILTYKSLVDNKIMLGRTLLANSIYDANPFDMNGIIHKVSKVTKNDVIEVAKNIDINTIYLLGGKIDE